MFWFYMSIAQIALDPPSVKRANVEKVPQTIMASLYNLPPCPYGNNTFQKGASLNRSVISPQYMFTTPTIRQPHPQVIMALFGGMPIKL